jgi:uncharacterized protein YbbK (DUF523 family)/uncharacterized protein YbgA (DUF1722 family)
MSGSGTAGASEGVWARPRLVVSACLEFEACRFNGHTIRARFLPRLAGFADLVPVCPEVEIGLGVPRPPVRLVSIGGEHRMIQPTTGRDVTEDMHAFSTRFLDGVGDVDGFLLKSRSPSCGHKEVKVYGENGVPREEKAAGLFAAAVAERNPLTVVEDEGRLTNYRLRHHFLTRIFLVARLRGLPERVSALVRFHAANKLLLLACSEGEARELGRIVANAEALPVTELMARYREGFARALANAPKPGPVVNTLQHAFGHVSRHLVPAEKRIFAEAVESYRARRGSLEAPLALLQAWNARIGLPWLDEQTFFRPYPAALHDLSDSAGEVRAA